MPDKINIFGKDLINQVNTGSNKADHIEKLGHFLYTNNPEPNESLKTSVLKVSTFINQLEVLSVYYISFFNEKSNGWEQVKKTVKEIIKELYPNNEDESICKLYLLMARRELLDDKDAILILREAAICVIRIENHWVRSNLIPQIALSIRRKVDLDNLLNIIKSFEHEKYDSMTDGVYSVLTHPNNEKYYNNKEVEEVYNRNANDWILWCMLSQNIPAIEKDILLRFKYILHISRFSHVNHELKKEFLSELLHYCRSSEKTPKECFMKLNKINSIFSHSTFWKEKVEDLIMKSEIKYT